MRKQRAYFKSRGHGRKAKTPTGDDSEGRVEGDN
jgi:hypothetical protein